MLELLQMLGLLFKLFAIAISTVTSGIVVYALVQWLVDKRNPSRPTP
jgi:hypothetical protein